MDTRCSLADEWKIRIAVVQVGPMLTGKFDLYAGLVEEFTELGLRSMTIDFAKHSKCCC